jgi:prolycopene isomerase
MAGVTATANRSYDAVVIGAGLGGLSAAAFLAKAGANVLAVERLEGVGGYTHAFSRPPYTFDPCVHAIGATAPGMPVDTWLHALGVRDRVDFIPLRSFYTVMFPRLRVDVPYGVEAFLAAYTEAFPEAAQEIRTFVGVCQRMAEEWDQLRPGLSLEELAATGGGLPTVLRYRGSTLADVLDEYVQDPQVRAALSVPWAYLATPPSRLSFLSFAGMLISLLDSGEAQVKGGFQKLADAFAAAIDENGGELVLGCEATRIVVHDRRVTGVTLADGTRVTAPVVVAAGDLTRTVNELVGAEHLPAAYLNRLRRMKLTPSAFIVYGATTLDVAALGTAAHVLAFDSPDLDSLLDRVRAGEVGGFGVHFPTLHEPGAAPDGQHVFVAIVQAPFDIGIPWHDAKARYTDAVIDKLDHFLPGLRNGLVFVEGATPTALQHWSLNRDGAMCGWENSPHQTQHRRPSNRTPLEGLYVAGDWAYPGSGTIHAINSGFQCAMHALDFRDPGELFAALDFTPAASVAVRDRG